MGRMWLRALRSGASTAQRKHPLPQCQKGSFFVRQPRAPACHQAVLKRYQHSYHNPGALDRLQELRRVGENVYPRISAEDRGITCREYCQRFKKASTKEPSPLERIVLRGRVNAVRKAGARLVFIDLVQDGNRVQTLCNFRNLSTPSITLDKFRHCFQRIRRGDNIQVEGYPSQSDSGEPTLSIESLPLLLSPCLPDLPTKLDDLETRARLRHLDLLVNRRLFFMLRLKSEVTQYLRAFLLRGGHLEVNTPILSATAGGAIARPFETVASEFSERKLSLRIAPELWLKRLIVGGCDRVFEIGPSFRNEGVDLIHNPEFTTCEFYTAFASLEDLMRTTENMLSGLFSHLQGVTGISEIVASPVAGSFRGPYPRIDFINHVEASLGQSLPDLNTPEASENLIAIMEGAGIEVPGYTSLPQLLDRLSSHFIEPNCIGPTFIVHHPECLSPLAKSFKHPHSGQMVAARAELFVNGLEVVNTYEEENSPVEQRRKFEEQARFKVDHGNVTIDEGYLEALEWGLPPTGGWGGGIERLCMVMSASNRIGDMLSFGTLRNVVGLGHGASPRH